MCLILSRRETFQEPKQFLPHCIIYAFYIGVGSWKCSNLLFPYKILNIFRIRKSGLRFNARVNYKSFEDFELLC